MSCYNQLTLVFCHNQFLWNSARITRRSIQYNKKRTRMYNTKVASISYWKISKSKHGSHHPWNRHTRCLGTSKDERFGDNGSIPLYCCRRPHSRGISAWPFLETQKRIPWFERDQIETMDLTLKRKPRFFGCTNDQLQNLLKENGQQRTRHFGNWMLAYPWLWNAAKMLLSWGARLFARDWGQAVHIHRYRAEGRRC